MQQGYGLTETAPVVTILDTGIRDSKVGSSGRADAVHRRQTRRRRRRTKSRSRQAGRGAGARRQCDARLLGPARRDRLAIDADGWFRTGDAAYFDADGFLTISDRIKDMIISGGENVYPAEVESALMRHPDIAEVAVIGEPDEQWGEAVVAIAALKPGKSLTIEDLRAFAGELLARYKLPRRLETVSALPRNATGKILKYQLRKTFARQGDKG